MSDPAFAAMSDSALATPGPGATALPPHLQAKNAPEATRTWGAV
jgi:hypothetical protein